MEKTRSASLIERKTIGKFLLENNTYVMFICLFIACSLLSKDFFSWRNIGNLIRQNSAYTFMVMGMLFVIITGGIDLSVGAMVALGSVGSAYVLTNLGLPVFLAFILPLALTTILGLVTGLLVSYAKMASFVASLAMMTMARGLALVIANGSPIIVPKGSIEQIATIKLISATPELTKTLGEITPLLGLFILIIVLVFWFIQKYTSYGRIILAIGSNETAVRLAGINVRAMKTSVYAISGLCSGFAGIIAATRTQVGAPVAGMGWELDAIAACVIGGASLSGGSGTAFKALVGVFVLALIGNIMNLLAIPSYPQDIIKGAIIIFAVLLQTKSFKDE